MAWKLVENERAKYLATFFNNLAVASFAAGAVIPAFAPGSSMDKLAVLGAGTALAILLIFLAYRTLGGLKE